MTGIYAITNKVNGKMYIGQSVDIEKRWKQHKSELRNNKHINGHLQNSWNKYNEDNFEFTVIEECDISVINEREIYWISHYKTTTDNNGYNLRYGGDSEIPTEEVKKKISKAHKGIPCAEETKRKISESRIGKYTGENSSFYGKKHTEETRQKMRDNHWDCSGKNNPMYGVKRPKEQHPMFGKNHSEETKLKISIANSNPSEETREKIAKAHRGVKLSEEHRNKVIKTLHMKHGEDHPSAILKEDQVIPVIEMLVKGISMTVISRETGVKYDLIKAIKYKKSWTHLTKNLNLRGAS